MYLRWVLISYVIYAVIGGIGLVATKRFGLSPKLPFVMIVFVAPALVAFLYAGDYVR